jgi:hypothetical protein
MNPCKRLGHYWTPLEQKRPMREIGFYAMRQLCSICFAEREMVLDKSKINSQEDWWK